MSSPQLPDLPDVPKDVPDTPDTKPDGDKHATGEDDARENQEKESPA
jgi:hypothetical protein